ncbi:hypothetical protein PACTADRAFT_71566 [Pachysolen tannophilus NRRL Y-2460]|uniref:5-oxoprolinase n=1 Tax=Pachysolen tannophilus NRRL Y-2460 TaxID=669874 RepID=A0A1E4TPQ6_PACTA|nr:hypothetical protein PACTADRAFT_71566 [Pachysolen tannophilus NRRL Y-2460]
MTIAGNIKIAIDRGGTFTDVLAIIPGKEDYVFKLLSVDPSNYKDANIEGIRRVLEYATGEKISRGVPLDTSKIENIRLGTTVATNALLERKGVRFALLVTKGFKDLLHIGNQSRPNLFDLNIRKPGVLYEKVIEIEERVTLPAFSEDSTGYQANDLVDNEKYIFGETKEVIQIVKPLNIEKSTKDLIELKNIGINSIAICLVHGYNYQEHEKTLGEIARKIGFKNISLSHELLPMIKVVNRGHSTCIDAYLTPIIKLYIENLLSGFQKDFYKYTRVEFMMSDGGLCQYDKFTGLKALLSGPAGGVVGHAQTCYDPEEGTYTIGFDMGGTSTDVSRYSGVYDHIFETTTAGIKIAAPQLDINTVAAGGGSILKYENGIYLVGPESAGAHPGPACYRKGGPLTVTDANLMCSRILPEFFPKIFGKNENQELDKEIVRQKFQDLADLINSDHPEVNARSPYDIALGFLKVANVAMAKPIRQLTENKGFDVSKHNLASFGGAGGQHANSLAKVLKMKRIVIHKYSSILSAYGIALADVVHEAQEPASAVYSLDIKHNLLAKCEILKQKVNKELLSQGVTPDIVNYDIFFNMGYKGSDSSLMIMDEKGEKDFDFLEKFYLVHQRQFSFNDKSREVIVNDIRVRGSGNINKVKERSPFKDLLEVEKHQVSKGIEKLSCPIYFEEGFLDSKVYFLNDIGIGSIIVGPALIIDATQTILVEPGSKLTILPRHLIMDLSEESPNVEFSQSHVDPVQLSIFSHRFMSIAESMCTTLQKISVSANIKERMDFSCALFDEEGNLVANAPAVPVHLSSMSFAVKFQIKYWDGNINEGDILATNHPKAMGTHLPDITLISPIFVDGHIRFYVGSRAHHAEIGGTKPGSMDSSATGLDQEGAKFVAWKVVSKSQFDYDGVQKYFIEEPNSYPGSSPSRKVADNISDIKAQIASNRKGIDLLRDVFTEFGTDVVLFYMRAIKDTSEIAVRKFLQKLARENRHRLPLTSVDYMDDGAQIAIKIDINEEDGSAIFDFTGTSEEAYNCYNAPRAITYACITYCLRCHITEGDLPLNEGVLAPIKVIIPEGTILNPSETAAVSAGNGNTSQKITDTILKAFGTVAASYGCMNAICFGQGGNDKNGKFIRGFGFCETIGGGSGAGNGFNGFSGTQCHMTNTLMTDPEVLEKRYPCILLQFSVREGTGGKGKWHGGNGLIRELQFTSQCHASVLTQRRTYEPYGMAGGKPGKRGANRLGRCQKDGRIVWKYLGSNAEIELNIGDVLKISTPGGGGYGKPQARTQTTQTQQENPNEAFYKFPRSSGSLAQLQEALSTSQ